MIVSKASLTEIAAYRISNFMPEIIHDDQRLMKLSATAQMGFLRSSVSSEGWHVQWESVPPG